MSNRFCRKLFFFLTILRNSSDYVVPSICWKSLIHVDARHVSVVLRCCFIDSSSIRERVLPAMDQNGEHGFSLMSSWLVVACIVAYVKLVNTILTGTGYRRLRENNCDESQTEYFNRPNERKAGVGIVKSVIPKRKLHSSTTNILFYVKDLNGPTFYPITSDILGYTFFPGIFFERPLDVKLHHDRGRRRSRPSG